jgi:hypothetical protein
LSYTK